MHGGVNYNGNTLLTGGINVNTTGNIQALNVQVTENGERTITPPEGVDGYAPITIDTNVPIPEPVLDTLNVTSNGTYTPPSGVDGYDEVNVSVPTPEPVLDTLNVTSNGTYTPPTGTDGYDEVNVSVSGYTIKTLSTTPTSIASFTDGTANPLKSLTASIVPVQAGSGEPSPTNVRPISGWDEAVVTRCGKNLWGGEKLADDIVAKVPNATKDTTNKTVSYSAGYVDGKVLFDNFKPNTRYTIFMMTSSATNNIRIKYTDGTNESISKGAITVTQANKSIECLIGVWLTGSTVLKYEECGIFEGVITAQDFEPYNGQTYTIPFTDGQGQSVEVFGGSVDVVNGVVTHCPYYASYNGEQLTGEWISDRDVYAEDTTPTIGAQVVNIGATGTPFYTQPTSIKSIDGENNLWASTGQIEELEYFANL